MAGHPAGVSGAAVAGSERTDPTLQGVSPVRQHGAATPRGVREQDSSGGEHREGGDLAVRSGVQHQPEAAQRGGREAAWVQPGRPATRPRDSLGDQRQGNGQQQQYQRRDPQQSVRGRGFGQCHPPSVMREPASDDPERA